MFYQLKGYYTFKSGKIRPVLDVAVFDELSEAREKAERVVKYGAHYIEIVDSSKTESVVETVKPEDALEN